MRIFKTSILLLLLGLFIGACDNKTVDPDPDPDADISLDELIDCQEYAEGMIVDSRYIDSLEVSKIVVNNKEHKSPRIIDLTLAGYYHLEIFTKMSVSTPYDVVRVVVLDPERGQAEWGLPPWTPEGVEIQTIGSQEIKTIYPQKIPGKIHFPLVVVIDGQLTRSIDNLKADVGEGSFLIKRGVGSTWLASDDPSNSQVVIDHRTFPIQTSTMEASPLSLSGELEADLDIAPDSYIHIAEDLTIPSGISLTIGEGVFITIDQGVNIYNEGSLLIEGTELSPVTLTCSDNETYWGGVIGKAEGNRVVASHTLFCRSGYNTGPGYYWGHAGRQGLFYSENGEVRLDHCYMIDHIGQVCYSESASIKMDYCLVQRAKTGGQLNASQVSIDHSVFTDFPDDSFTYRDADNDALYLIECVAGISNSVFMYAKDDGLDSGGGSYEGEVTVSNTRFESIFHEGAALSGGNSLGKHQYFYNCIFLDCGQGLELGFSSPEHRVVVDSCSFYRNGIGIRYGDCYDFGNRGFLSVSNSESLENRTYDVWNMDRKDWEADTSHMEFNNVWVSSENPMYPQLKIRE